MRASPPATHCTPCSPTRPARGSPRLARAPAGRCRWSAGRTQPGGRLSGCSAARRAAGRRAHAGQCHDKAPRPAAGRDRLMSGQVLGKAVRPVQAADAATRTRALATPRDGDEHVIVELGGLTRPTRVSQDSRGERSEARVSRLDGGPIWGSRNPEAESARWPANRASLPAPGTPDTMSGQGLVTGPSCLLLIKTTVSRRAPGLRSAGFRPPARCAAGRGSTRGLAPACPWRSVAREGQAAPARPREVPGGALRSPACQYVGRLATRLRGRGLPAPGSPDVRGRWKDLERRGLRHPHVAREAGGPHAPRRPSAAGLLSTRGPRRPQNR